jgi:transketolase
MQIKSLSLRESFGRALIKIAKERDDFVVLDANVAGGTCTNLFEKECPQRFIQCGISEQNMMGVAAGIASLEKIIPIATTYAVFASMRAIEQIRNSIAYPNLNAKIAASHVGVDTGPDGATHQSIEDIAIFRSIPNMVVLAPADHFEMEKTVRKALSYKGPVYIRTGRSPTRVMFDSHYKFEIGKGNVLRGGKDVTIIAVGVMVYRAVKAAQKLEKERIKTRVIDMCSIKPIDEELIIKAAKETEAIVTAEDHNKIGGLRSAVAEVITESYPVVQEYVAINDVFGESGEPDELAVKHKLTDEDIYKACLKAIERKNN